MAIDTANKRRSSCSFGVFQNAYIIPDGTIDQGNRQTICNIYSGILVDAPIVITPDCYQIETGEIVTLAAYDGEIDSSVVFVTGLIEDNTFVVAPLCC